MTNQDLGVLFPGFQTSKSSYLADDEVSEVYNLSVESPGYIEIQLKDLVADADLYFYDLSLPGEDVLDSSTSYGAYQEESIRRYLEAGNYLISVRNVNNIFNSDSFFDPNVFRRNTDYTLDISFDIENSSSNTTTDSSSTQGLVTSPSIELTTPAISNTQSPGLGGYIGARPVEDTTSNFSNSQGAGLGGYIGAVPSNQEQSTNSQLVVEESVDGSEWNASFFLFDGQQPPTDFYLNEANKFAVLNLGRGGNSFSADWGLYSPDPRVPRDNFAIRSYTHADFEPGKEYEFTVRADDGYQLLAKHHITNQWVYITPQETWEYDYGGDTFTYRWPDYAPGGKYDLHFHYYEETGNAYFELSWAEKSELPITFVPEPSYVDSGGSATLYTDNTTSEPSYVDSSNATTFTFDDSENGGSPFTTTSSIGDSLINGAADVVTGNFFSQETVCGVGDERNAEIVGLPFSSNPILNAHQPSCFIHDYLVPDDKDPVEDFDDPGVILADATLALTSPNPVFQVAFGTKASLGAAAAVGGAVVDGTNTVLDGIATGINDLENAITSGWPINHLF
ncbi:MAG: hypothetical protein F6K22_26600 [Okeania sp. SIO2F4]|uniref:hypothetical protein n=1 Tax=Okeania sp. SIO2F4 TaxID=2607790 RepID=UPI00142C49E5|nr:hypothetical protein [Okeania sp. SIO2F4]NES06059.1 hypothetical protein [Okeania sp. SIO2F4]